MEIFVEAEQLLFSSLNKLCSLYSITMTDCESSISVQVLFFFTKLCPAVITCFPGFSSPPIQDYYFLPHTHHERFEDNDKILKHYLFGLDLKILLLALHDFSPALQQPC